MLVYGDPQFQERLGCIREHLACRLARPPEKKAELDFWRSFLIQAGQLEQGLADAAENALCEWAVPYAVSLTDAAAENFMDAWAGAPIREDSRVSSRLRELLPADEQELTIKVPEGYEFYGLFPEQYLLSAQAWARDKDPAACNEVLVVGVRSIGTSLSALVAATLRRLGWSTRRMTVRPKGHPFGRELSLRPQQGAKAYALVVDEGPGISGSSMAAVAAALVEAGLNRHRIAFFPGHGKAPGHAASETVREWCRTVPRYFTRLEEVAWEGQSLKTWLLNGSARLLSATGVAESSKLSLQDVTGGAWLPLVLPEQGKWPAVFGLFERQKYRCEGPAGKAVLWKFSGLGSLMEGVQTARITEGGNLGTGVSTLPLLESIRGFKALPWVNGKALTIADVTDRHLRAVARYLVRTAEPPLEELAAASALQRLEEMLVVNTRERLGEKAGQCAEAWEIPTSEVACLPTCADGRMSPHEWIQQPNGSLVKTDSTGNQVDHTLVGRQPLLWDIAGVLIAWALDDRQNATFQQFLKEEGLQWADSALQFYLAAYAAFKMGQAVMCASMAGPNRDNVQRLEQAADGYASRLSTALYRAAEQSFMHSTRGP